MGYPRSVYIAALAELEKRKRNAEDEAALHREEFAQAEPLYTQFTNEMRQTAYKTAKIVLSRDKDAAMQMEAMKQENLYLQQQISLLLSGHGYAKNYLEPAYTCPKCKDTGYIDGYMCDCLKQLARDIACKKLNELSPLTVSSFDDLDLNCYSSESAGGGVSPRKRMESIIGFCKNYADTFSLSSQSLMFTGATGLGKTHLSLAIAGVVTKKGFGVAYGSVQSFLTRLEQERFGKGNAQGDECRTMLMDCDLLILDDLGSEFSTSFTVSAVYDIINTRILSGKPTIISTNLSLAEIEERYTERVLSRLCGCYKVFRFDGTDIRTMRF